MAEEISDEQFKAEVLRFIEVANQKFDGLSTDVRSNSFKLDRVEAELHNVKVEIVEIKKEMGDLGSDVRALSSQFQDVGVMAIKDHKRIDSLEEKIGNLDTGVH